MSLDGALPTIIKWVLGKLVVLLIFNFLDDVLADALSGLLSDIEGRSEELCHGSALRLFALLEQVPTATWNVASLLVKLEHSWFLLHAFHVQTL
mmetsp:Transcript_9074/g.10694  ORF Transcript_9074/g.10694 Transcript_9074/m.10694 type:complete len:94 (-) Transcript_9074:609-890(-)